MTYAIPAAILLMWILGWCAFRRPVESEVTQSPHALLSMLKRRRALVLQLSLIFIAAMGFALSLLFEPASENHRFQAATGILLTLMVLGFWAAPRQV